MSVSIGVISVDVISGGVRVISVGGSVIGVGGSVDVISGGDSVGNSVDVISGGDSVGNSVDVISGGDSLIGVGGSVISGVISGGGISDGEISVLLAVPEIGVVSVASGMLASAIGVLYWRWPRSLPSRDSYCCPRGVPS